MALNHEHGRSDAAAKVARKLLRLNPGDNLGVRYLLPFVLLEKAELAAAKRSLRALADEIGLTAAVARAFVAFAKDERATFRRELATALFTLPMLRALLLNSPKALPAGESGIGRSNRTWRRLQCIVPGLRAACVAFLAEPVVRTAELELRTYWSGYREARRDPKAQPVGSREGWERLLAQGIDRVAPADTHSSRS